METKHTPGPWSVGYFCDIRANDGYHSLATVSSHYGLPGGANARRIVECVNACEGLADPSVVPELLEALVAQKKWQSLQDAYNAIVLLADERDTRSVDDMDRAWDEFLDARIKADWLLDAAIAKATGKTL